VETSPDLADRCGVWGLPALLFKQGRVAAQALGFVPKRVLARHLEALSEAPEPEEVP
jgi:hypothetical protein